MVESFPILCLLGNRFSDLPASVLYIYSHIVRSLLFPKNLWKGRVYVDMESVSWTIGKDAARRHTPFRFVFECMIHIIRRKTRG